MASVKSNPEAGAVQFRKMTETPIPGLIIRLAIPTVLSMLVTNVYNLVDTAFVGRLGNSASGAIGIVFGYMAILQSVGFMFGQGGGSIVSRMLGAKDLDSAGRHASTAVICSFLSGALLSVLSYFILDPLIVFLGSTETIAPYAKQYIHFIMFAAPFMTSSFTMNNVLRYEGKAALGMIGLMAGGILNMIGDPIFMFGFDMGISGAGLSTCISQIISFMILLSIFLRRKTSSVLSFSNFVFSLSFIGNIMATGFPSLVRQGLGSAATIILNWHVRPYGDEAMAAMSIVSRISFFMFSVALGVGQGFQPVSAFNYGAGRYGRVKQAFRFTFLSGEAFIAIACGVVFLLSGDVIRLFRDDPEVILIGTRALRLQCGAMLFLPFAMITEMMYQSTGKKLGAAILSALRSGICFIPLIFLMARTRGLYGIEEAQPLSYIMAFFPAVYFAIRHLRSMPEKDREAGP
ncbi:MAG: MATE family efflux transporter [Lachnospiraceae bacterium]|nr:MATE family efflux transporter [Lachnospiraceae bacterium]